MKLARAGAFPSTLVGALAFGLAIGIFATAVDVIASRAFGWGTGWEIWTWIPMWAVYGGVDHTFRKRRR